MRRRRWLAWLLAFLLALLVNGSGLYLIIQVNAYVHAPAKSGRATARTLVLHEPPAKKRRQRVRHHAVAARPRAVPMPVPDLPSSISAEQLMPAMGRVDLFTDMLGEQQSWDAELILKEEAVDEPPRLISRAVPEYPEAAEDRGIEGQVELKLQVSAAGRVEKVWIVKADPPGVFEASAERAARAYRFSPARFRGQPVAVLCRQKIVFKLED
ncbi:MAG: TonB family protein [Deltaproteobacteria bacterium]|nr:TonB family protein [Deltaproteobacteria bacterium]